MLNNFDGKIQSFSSFIENVKIRTDIKSLKIGLLSLMFLWRKCLWLQERKKAKNRNGEK